MGTRLPYIASGLGIFVAGPPQPVGDESLPSFHARGTLIALKRIMESEPKERWLELCKLAEKEQDAGKLITLVSEINRLLEEKRFVPKRDSAAAASRAFSC